MNAEPFLADIVRHLNELQFDVVLIGNAAAALQGAPVTTVDFDVMFTRTPGNLRKLKALAGRLDATARRPRDLAVIDTLEKTREEANRTEAETGRARARKRPRTP